MGLLYEYSKPNSQHHIKPPTDAASTTADIADLPDIQVQTSQQVSATSTKDDTRRIRGRDVLIAFIIMMMAFCTVITMSAIALIPVPSADFTQATGGPFSFNLEAIAAASQSQFIALYAYNAVHFAVGLIAAIGFILFRLGGEWSKLGTNRLKPQGVYYAIGMGFIGGLGVRGGTILAAWFAGDIPAMRNNILTVLENTSSPVILIALGLWLFALPLTQELFFRGVIYTWLRHNRGLISALFLTGLINSIFNLFLLDAFTSLMIGAGLAFIYERTNSVWGAYLAHSSFNMITVAIYILLLSTGG